MPALLSAAANFISEIDIAANDTFARLHPLDGSNGKPRSFRELALIDAEKTARGAKFRSPKRSPSHDRIEPYPPNPEDICAPHILYPAPAVQNQKSVSPPLLFPLAFSSFKSTLTLMFSARPPLHVVSQAHPPRPYMQITCR